MVPNGWKLTSLGEVCSGKLQTGPFGSQLHADEYTDEGIPVLMPKDIINFRANTAIAAKIPEYRANDLKKHYLKSGDLLFSRRGDVTRFALIEKDTPKSICGTGCLKAIPNKAHSALFLSYFLQKDAVKKWLEQNAVGQTMPNMNTTILSELPLMVASSRDEEDKIAKILSTWDKAIATTERLIATSQQQKKALMQQLLTGKKRLVNPDTGMVFEGDWEDKHLNEFSQVIVSPVDKKSIEGETPVALCNYTDVYYNMRITNKLSFMKATATQAEIKKFTLQIDDVVITKDSETPGDIAIPALVSEKLKGVVCGYHLAIVRTNKQLADGAFINYLFSIPKTRYYFFTLATGATRFGLSVDGINKAHFSLPSIKEQQKIASVLTATDKEIELIEAKLAHLKEEKKALMQQLLTGKRRVKVDAKEVA
jgi:type I restriction enzyme S subunit